MAVRQTRPGALSWYFRSFSSVHLRRCPSEIRLTLGPARSRPARPAFGDGYLRGSEARVRLSSPSVDPP
jgi:hypothetical protein